MKHLKADSTLCEQELIPLQENANHLTEKIKKTGKAVEKDKQKQKEHLIWLKEYDQDAVATLAKIDELIKSITIEEDSLKKICEGLKGTLLLSSFHRNDFLEIPFSCISKFLSLLIL